MRVRAYLIVLCLVCGGGGLLLSAAIVARQNLVDQAVLALEEAVGLQHDSQRLEDSLRQVFLSSDLLFGASETYMFTPLQSQLADAVELLRLIQDLSPGSATAENSPLDALLQQLAQLNGELDAFEQQMSSGDLQASNAQLARVDDLSTLMIESSDALHAVQEQRVTALRMAESDARTEARRWLVPLCLGYLLMVLGTLLWVTRRLSHPIQALALDADDALEDYERFRPRQSGPQEVVRLTGAIATLFASLRRRMRETRAIIEAIPDTLLLIHRSGAVRYWKRSSESGEEGPADEDGTSFFAQLLTDEEQRRVQQAIAVCIDEDRSVLLELAVSLDDGRHIFELRLSPSADDTAVVLARDLTEAKAAEARIRELAYQDELTGLMNRAAFLETISQRIADTPDDHFGLLFIDLDRFKWVNDTQGHDAGDFVLQEISARIRRMLRGADSLAKGVRQGENSARIGGDEFLVLLPGVADERTLMQISERLMRAMLEPIEFAGRSFSVGASMGGVLFPNDGDNSETLIKHADIAMYESKRTGSSTPCLFSAKMGDRSRRLLQMEERLRSALPSEQLYAVYQPQLTLRDGRLAGVEALVRWQDGDRLCSPAEFIPLAEETGLIGELGRRVLDQAVAQLVAWDRAGLDVPSVAVNVSGLQFKDDGVHRAVTETLERHALAPSRLVLEVTESVLLDSAFSPLVQLEALRALGVRLALDDFGTGYSSLSHLRDLPIDVLKIDRHFVGGMGADPKLQHIVRMIIELGQELGMQVLAEGVESEAEAALLNRFGCDEVQGYLYARPLAVADFPGYLSTRATPVGTEIVTASAG